MLKGTQTQADHDRGKARNVPIQVVQVEFPDSAESWNKEGLKDAKLHRTSHTYPIAGA